MYVSIGQASEIAGVSISTLRRWEKDGSFLPSYRTKGGHRRYFLEHINKEILDIPDSTNNSNKKVVAYARVSSSDQKLDLERQKNRLSQHCTEQNWNYEVISDLGSGLNMKKKGLNRLIEMICSQQVSRLVLTHRDRLLRFGSPLLFKLCEFFGTEIVVLDSKPPKDFEEELAADVIEIITVFTAKMYGRRSHQNRKAACA